MRDDDHGVGSVRSETLATVGAGEYSILIIRYSSLNCEISATWAFGFLG